MRVMLDTNIIISAILFPKGRTAQAFLKAICPPCQPYVCDYIVDELRRKIKEKFPTRTEELETFLASFLPLIHVVPTPRAELPVEKSIRDPKDRPILRAALNAHSDLFLTGDKDFLESSLTNLRIISVAEFLTAAS